MQGDTNYSSTSAKKDPDVLEDRDHAMFNVHSHTDFKALHGKFLRNWLDHSASLHPRVKKKKSSMYVVPTTALVWGEP